MKKHSRAELSLKGRAATDQYRAKVFEDLLELQEINPDKLQLLKEILERRDRKEFFALSEIDQDSALFYIFRLALIGYNEVALDIINAKRTP